MWAWAGAGCRRVVNLFTQEPAPNEHAHPGKASIENVNHCLRELHKWIETEKITSLALPRLATGVGGLEWTQVQPLIVSHLGGLHIPIIVYSTFHKGMQASDKGIVCW